MNLGRLQKKSLDLLLAGLTAPDPVISADAARLLGELARPETMEALLAYVSSSPYYSKTAGFYALLQIGRPEACDHILPLIENPGVGDDWVWYGRYLVRISAALSVLALDPTREPGVIDEACRSEHWTHRTFCLFYSPVILMLPATNEKTVLLRKKTLEGLFSKKFFQPDHLCMMSRALGLLGGAEAIEQLKWLQGHPSRFVRGEAAYHLLKGAGGESHLGFGLELFEKEPTEYAKLKLSAGLLALGQKKQGDFLRKTIEMEKDFFLRATAVELAGRERCLEALPLLILRLKDEHPYVRQCSVEALDALQIAEGLAQIEPLLEDGNQRVRMQAAKCVLSSVAGGEP